MSLFYVREAAQAYERALYLKTPDELLAECDFSGDAYASSESEENENWSDEMCESDDAVVDKRGEVGVMLVNWVLEIESIEDLHVRVNTLESIVQAYPLSLVLLMAGNRVSEVVKRFEADGQSDGLVDCGKIMLEVLVRKIESLSEPD